MMLDRSHLEFMSCYNGGGGGGHDKSLGQYSGFLRKGGQSKKVRKFARSL